MRKNFILAVRSLFKKGRNNLIKILSLSAGLALGLVLIAKVYFDQTFDNFYPDRIYQVQTNYKMESMDSAEEYGQVSGGVAVGMRDEIPAVEAGTRLTYLIPYTAIFYTTDDNKNYKATNGVILADSCFYDLLPRPMIAGNAKEILSRPMHAIVSRSIAEAIGDNVVGRTIVADDYPGKTITIAGIFEDIPGNSHFKYDIAISLSSIKEFMWDGSLNWLFNDRYMGYVRLTEGVNYYSLNEAINEIQARHIPKEELNKMGLSLSYKLKPVKILHSASQYVKRRSILLSLIAFALLFTAIMNYILVSISTLVSRSKEVGVYKCYGAKGRNIASVMLTETAIHLCVSIVLAVVFLFTFKSVITDLLGTSVSSLFTLSSCLLLAGICMLVFLIAGIIPSQLFAYIPVAAAFRTHSESRRHWKLGLLFVQFVGCVFLVTLLVIIGKQYRLMVNDNPGYNYENVLFCKVSGVNNEYRNPAMDEVSRIPGVKLVSAASVLPFEECSGNIVSEVGSDKELLNFADLETADHNFLNLMEIPVIAGQGFTEKSVSGDIVVSKAFAEQFCSLTGTDINNIVGKDVHLAQWGNRKIVGIYDNIRTSSIAYADSRPTVILYDKNPTDCIIIKAETLNSELIMKVQTVLEKAIPNKHIVLEVYKNNMISLYSDSRKFRDSVMIGGIITLIISLIGLIGYTNDEINRRSSEIAIRKINGATMSNIQRLFIKDIAYIAIPSIVFGAIAAYLTAIKWQEEFSEKAGLGLLIFVVCGIAVLAMILCTVIIDCYRVGNKNPVETLRS